MNLSQMSMAAGAVIIAIVLIRAVAIDRLPKRVFLLLWGIALLRLLIPVSMPIQIALPTQSPPSQEQLVITASPREQAPETQDPVSRAADAPLAEHPSAAVTVESVLRLVWIAGMAATAGVFAAIYLKSKRRLRYALPIGDGSFDFGEWTRQHKLLRPIAIMQSDKIATPFAVGILKPQIILPKCLSFDNEQILSHVLAHEHCHIKRFDALWKLFLVAALCVHWFNPLVWIMFVLVNRDLELACDEAVVRQFGAQTKAAYANSIISMAEQRNKLTLFENGFSKNAAVERIQSIMKTGKKSTIGTFIAVLLVAIMALSAFAAPSSAIASSDGKANESESYMDLENKSVVGVDSIGETIDSSDDADENIREIIEPETHEFPCRCCYGPYADKWYPHKNECKIPGSYCIFDLYCVLDCKNTDSPIPRMGYELTDSCSSYCIIAVCTECKTRIFSSESVFATDNQ